ncbi:porin [Saccharospirillum impatiens]|uniref:porin n=1 Tax=Saccharospirillum impatiens TaxID=169438 RepID=UPI0003FEE1E1|nr:porin [Saccharospirillum impatiens]
MKALWTVPVLALGVASASQAATTIYGAANANTFVNNNDAGTSLGIDSSLSHFGFRGDSEIDSSISAIFDARFYANIVEGGTPAVWKGHAGLEGDFGTLRIFGGPTPLTKTQSYLNLMEEDPLDFSLILGDGMLTPGASLPTGAKFEGYNAGINFTSNDLGNGLSFDGAVLPAQNPNGETGISLAATMAQNAFSVSGAFEVNGSNGSTQLFRLVGEYYLNEITVGGLLQFAGNADQDLNGTSFLGFAEMPLDISRWNTRLRLTGGYAAQENDADTIDETQLMFAAMHEIRFTNQVSAYNFGEVFLPEESAGNNTRIGTGLKIRF